MTTLMFLSDSETTIGWRLKCSVLCCSEFRVQQPVLVIRVKWHQEHHTSVAIRLTTRSPSRRNLPNQSHQSHQNDHSHRTCASQNQ